MSARSASVLDGSGRRPYSARTEKTSCVTASASRFVAGRRIGSCMAKAIDDSKPWKPTREQCAAAYGKSVPDVIAADLRVLFCGINPGLYSAAVRHHFARPGNRFWPTLFAAGFTRRILSPFEEHELLPLGWGITNVIARATAGADELAADEYRAGATR